PARRALTSAARTTTRRPDRCTAAGAPKAHRPRRVPPGRARTVPEGWDTWGRGPARPVAYLFTTPGASPDASGGLSPTGDYHMRYRPRRPRDRRVQDHTAFAITPRSLRGRGALTH